MALTDIVQVTLLVLGGLLVSGLTLNEIGGGAGVAGGFSTLLERAPEHFDMILTQASPYYKDLPGLSVLIGGMWIANLSYWGFNQYIIQRALAAKSLPEAQKGVIFAAFLKLLMPVIIVLPGIAAVMLAPDLARPDEAYPTMMRLLPTGIARPGVRGADRGDHRVHRIQDQFDRDHLHARHLQQDRRAEERDSTGGRRAHRGGVAILIAILTAKPLLGSFDQAFQYIQEFTGFFTPGISSSSCSDFLETRDRGRRARSNDRIVRAVHRAEDYWPELPFLDRMAVVFVLALVLAIVLSLLRPATAASNQIRTIGLRFNTTAGFNVGAAGVVLILIALYTAWW